LGASLATLPEPSGLRLDDSHSKALEQQSERPKTERDGPEKQQLYMLGNRSRLAPPNNTVQWPKNGRGHRRNLVIVMAFLHDHQQLHRGSTMQEPAKPATKKIDPNAVAPNPPTPPARQIERKGREQVLAPAPSTAFPRFVLTQGRLGRRRRVGWDNWAAG